MNDVNYEENNNEEIDEQLIEKVKDGAYEGNAEAQFLLGTCYEYGRGVEQDFDKAFHWYTQAAKQGHEEAIERLSEFQEDEEDSNPQDIKQLKKNGQKRRCRGNVYVGVFLFNWGKCKNE